MNFQLNDNLLIEFLCDNPQTVTDRLDLSLERDSIFYKLGAYGLISFSDYIFLLTVLSSKYLIINLISELLNSY